MQTEFFNRIRRIDYLIQIGGTGTPDEFARRLNISRKSLYNYLNSMKEMGAPIKYCPFRGSYYYEEEGMFKVVISFCKEKPARAV